MPYTLNISKYMYQMGSKNYVVNVVLFVKNFEKL